MERSPPLYTTTDDDGEPCRKDAHYALLTLRPREQLQDQILLALLVPH